MRPLRFYWIKHNAKRQEKIYITRIVCEGDVAVSSL